MIEFIICIISMYFIPLIYLAITFNIIKYITNKNKSIYIITPRILHDIKTFAPIPIINFTFAIILTAAMVLGLVLKSIIKLTYRTYNKIFHVPEE